MFKKLTTAVNTTTNKVINTVMGVETTPDEEFEALRRKYTAYTSSVSSMASHTKSQSAALTALNESIKKLAADLTAFVGEDHGIIPAHNSLLTAVEQFGAAISQNQETLKNFETNMMQLSKNLDIFTKEIAERDRLKMDFDKARHDYQLEAKKAAPSSTLPAVQQRMDQKKAIFDQRNVEVSNRLIESFRTRSIHDDYKALIESYARLFGIGAQIFQQITQEIASTPMYIAPAAVPYTAASIPTTTAAVSPRAAPPPVPSKGASAQPQAKALYAFKADATTELSLNPGDIITITNDSHAEWWVGTCNGRSGEFPANYVQRI